MSKENLKTEKDAIRAVVVDLLFTFLPAIILIFIRAMTDTLENFFARSDWSYISMILFGQALIKLINGVAENKNEKNSTRIVLHMSLLICFGLIPSIVVLVLIETGKSQVLLLVLQFIWLLSSVASYYFFGVIGNILSSTKTVKDIDFVRDAN